MMKCVNFCKTTPVAQRNVLHGLLAAALALASWTEAADAGQASTSFQVSVTLLPAGPGTCTTTVADNRSPVVTCRPPVTPRTDGGQRAGTTEAVLGYRIPDARMKLPGAGVELGEENYQAWGEYSSRMIIAGGVEYVEMTVTW